MMKDFSMHMLDIAQNSIRAGATWIHISIEEDDHTNRVLFMVKDNGCGMDETLLRQVKDPFATSRTERRVGLGLPMLNQTAVLCGGSLDIESQPGIGTQICAQMQNNHIDRPPLGDIAESVYILVSANPSIGFLYQQRKNQKTFIFDTNIINQALDGVPINTPDVANWIREYLQEGIAALTV